ncbi:phosphotransferase [Salisediminibacterium beveridgei]|uniref:phosphotransferase n=1 Tax=Salisediminibacterium beveridgei TaxID=632773 RepID=UPI003899E69F
MKHLEQFLGEDWQLRPAGGATGEAYIAEKGQQKIFIKRNSSPFLAVLSAEGIVPKLLWTKRLENGDVITAQEWIEGRKLNQEELNAPRVARLLRKIHRSTELMAMFKRMGNQPLLPEHVIHHAKESITSMTNEIKKATEGLHWLVDHVPVHNVSDFVVCHADVHHKNWIHYTEMGEDELYLIDWDGAQLADPVMDIAPLLFIYVPRPEWDWWLKEYGCRHTEEMDHKIRWYMVALCLENIAWYDRREMPAERGQWLYRLDKIIHNEWV